MISLRHAFPSTRVPFDARRGDAGANLQDVLERLERDNGALPESVAFTLWGTDNIKTYGESLAQVLGLVGVRPVPDALGRVNKLELIPLEELGRPRIDVVVSCSGVFRDLFINQMNLLDRAVKMAAEADEPLDQNYVRKHAMEQAEELNKNLKQMKEIRRNQEEGYQAPRPQPTPGREPSFTVIDSY